MNVYTTLDSEVQGDAESAVEDQLVTIEKQPGFKGISHAQFLKDHRWERESAGEGEVRPFYLQGALLCMNARTGEIYAMAGGRNHRESEFNRAVHASRQNLCIASALLRIPPRSRLRVGSKISFNNLMDVLLVLLRVFVVRRLRNK